MNEIVPESPEKESDVEDENSYVPETPQKDRSSPIKSRNVIPIPSFNRIRTSLGLLDGNVLVREDNAKIDSPKSRRYTTENRKSSASKKSPRQRSFKKDKYSNLQRVKVSLFHGKARENEAKKPSFTVDAKSFYGSSDKKVSKSFALAPAMVKPVNLQKSQKKIPAGRSILKKSVVAKAVVKKKSPVQASVGKKQKRKGEINCGVGHGIKKPKRKRSSLKNDSMDSDKSLSNKQNSSVIPIEMNDSQSENFDTSNVIESPNVEIYDSSRKFFKHVRRTLDKPVNSSTIVSSTKESQTIDFSVSKPIKKKLCTDKAKVEASKTANECIEIGSVNENLGLSEKNGELLIQPLIHRKDIDDWNKLAEDIDLNISDTNITNLESFNQVEDILKILEDDWVDPTAIETISMSAVNDFTVKKSNKIIEDVNSSIKSTSINIESNNTICQSTKNLVSTANDIQDINYSCSSQNIINLGLNDTTSLPVKLSLLDSTVTESHNSNLLSCKIIDTDVSTNIEHESKINIGPLDQSATASVFSKDVNSLLGIIHNDWIEDVEPEENLISVENDTLSLTEPNSNICDGIVLSKSIIDPMNNPNESQNIDAIEKSSKKYYPVFSKESTLGIVTDTPKKPKKYSGNRIKQTSDPKQYQIDAGQKLFGIIQCKECQLPYHLGDEEDEKYHKKYHNRWETSSRLKFQGWKNERIVFEDLSTNSKIILIEASDPVSHRKKVLDILEVIDVGLTEVNTSDYADDKVYCYIRNKSIIGLLISKQIYNAFRMIPESPELNCCSSESSPAKCGIDVIWTAEQYRRQGVATKLVDILRKNYLYGHVMSIEDIAFSIPTSSGKAFAEKYTKTRSFKVY